MDALMAERASRTRFDDFGFSAFTMTWTPETTRVLKRIPAHTHLDLELHLVESGSMAFELAGRGEEVGAGQVALLWAGIPHRAITCTADSIVHVAQVPLPMVLAWEGGVNVSAVLSGAYVRADSDPTDAHLFRRWSVDVPGPSVQLRIAAEREIEARIRRVLAGVPADAGLGGRGGLSSTTAGVAAACSYVSRHFTEALNVDDVARAVGWKRAHLMEAFRRTCGLTVWDYTTRLRVKEAERLLATTDLPVLSVASQAGFLSQSSMYCAFARIRQTTPGAFRRASWSELVPGSAPGLRALT